LWHFIVCPLSQFISTHYKPSRINLWAENDRAARRLTFARERRRSMWLPSGARIELIELRPRPAGPPFA
jgi:hypothetical protein